MNLFANPMIANAAGRAGILQAQKTPAATAPSGFMGMDPMTWLMISGALANGARGGGWGEAASGIAGALQMQKQQKEDEGRSDAQKRALAAFQLGDMKGAMTILASAKGMEGEALDMAANLEGREYDRENREYWWEKEGKRDDERETRNRAVAGWEWIRDRQADKQDQTAAFGHAERMADRDLAGRRSLIDYEYGKKRETMNDAPPEFGDENGLRNQFLGQSKPFIDVRDAYSRIQKITQARSPDGKVSPASDISLIFNFMKMNDPGSTVREGEYATAQNATGVPGQIRNAYNRAITGENLNPEMRADFVNAAGQLYAAQEESWLDTFDHYQGQAQRYRMDPAIIQDLRIAPAAEQGSGQGDQITIPEDLPEAAARVMSPEDIELWPSLSPRGRELMLKRLGMAPGPGPGMRRQSGIGAL